MTVFAQQMLIPFIFYSEGLVYLIEFGYQSAGNVEELCKNSYDIIFIRNRRKTN